MGVRLTTLFRWLISENRLVGVEVDCTGDCDRVGRTTMPAGDPNVGEWKRRGVACPCTVPPDGLADDMEK